MLNSRGSFTFYYPKFSLPTHFHHPYAAALLCRDTLLRLTIKIHKQSFIICEVLAYLPNKRKAKIKYKINHL